MKSAIVKGLGALMLASALSGCVAIKDAMEGGDDSADTGGGTPTGQNATSFNYTVNGTILPCTDPKANCEEGDTSDFAPTSFAMTKPVRKTAVVTTSADGSTATVTVDGKTLLQNVTKDSEYVKYGSNVTVTEYSGSSGDTGIKLKKVAGYDEFFFFDGGSANEKQTSATTGSVTGERVRGVSGTLAPSSKVRTATYKGNALGSVDTVGTESDLEVAFYGTSDFTANLEAKTLTGTLTATKAYIDQPGQTTDAPEYLGATATISNATIAGSEFSGGTVVLKDAAGTTIGNFSSSEVGNTGGFYGSDAEVLAGTVGAVKQTGTNQYLLFDADYWGTREEAPAN